MTASTLSAGMETGYSIGETGVVGTFARMAPDVGVAPQDFESLRVRNTDGRNARTTGTKKVLRRMQGFVIEANSEEAKVAFVEDGVTHEYYLPSRPLFAAGIRGENQPFQMDEVEMKTDAGMMVGYEFQPLAMPGDAFQDSFTLDEARKKKRDLIFKTFGHAKT